MTDTATESNATCSCGHGHDAHEHYRRGSDCALCPPGVCARFTAKAGDTVPLTSDPIVRPPATEVPLA